MKALLVFLFVTTAIISQPSQAELSTLFTTPQERQIINANRYKIEQVTRPIQMPEPDIEEIRPQIQERVEISFSVTGITISNSGPNTVWINNQMYEEGEHLEDNSHFKVITGNDIRVRITTPDGKHYYATSGETVDVSYLVSVSN